MHPTPVPLRRPHRKAPRPGLRSRSAESGSSRRPQSCHHQRSVTSNLTSATSQLVSSTHLSDLMPSLSSDRNFIRPEKRPPEWFRGGHRINSARKKTRVTFVREQPGFPVVPVAASVRRSTRSVRRSGWIDFPPFEIDLQLSRFWIRPSCSTLESLPT